MSTPISRLDRARDAVRALHPTAPSLGIVAGSGLGALADLVENPTRIPYEDIPGMSRPRVIGHAGELVLGTLEGLNIAVLAGRVHAYEGHPMEDVVFGVRLLGRLGAPAVMLTNAAGGIPPWMGPGSLVRLTDHLNMSGANPLTGENIDELGPRFPDMSAAYDPDFGERLDQSARNQGVTLERGVYACMSGPSYETPAEVRMLRTLGATTVGMSTACEAIALRHMGVKVGAISVVSNHAAGVVAGVLDHSEVKEVANEAGPRLLSIVRDLAKGLIARPL